MKRNVVLMPYQKEGVDTVEDRSGRCLIADQMGLGKTVQVLEYLYRNPELRPAIIVCPASLKWNWQKEASLHYGMRIDVLESRTPSLEGLVKPDILVINYDVLKDWIPYLLKLKPQVVAADECHYLKTPGAQRTRAVRALIKRVKHFLPISGTPLTNRPIELYPVLNMLWPKKFRNRHAFGVNFCNAKKTPWGWQYRGAKNLKRLHRILTKYGMVRRLKSDVLKDLPAKQRVVVPIPLKNINEYKEAAGDLISWLRSYYGNAHAQKANRAEALVKVGYLKRLAAKLKLQYVIQWVKNWRESSDEKLMLFGIHKKILSAFKEEFKGQFACVTGDVTGKDRQHQFDKFNKDPDCWLFIGNIQAAGTGWSASACSNVAFVELDWVPGNHTQAEDRVHGIGRGQKGMHSTAYYLIANATIEEKLCEIIQAKQKTLDLTLDGYKHEELDLFDKLCRELMGRK